MIGYLENSMVSFLLVLLERVFKSGLRSHDRDHSPAPSLETSRIQRGLRVVYVEGLAEQVFLLGHPSDYRVFHTMPTNVVRVQFVQLFATGVWVCCAMGPLHAV